MKQHVRWFTRVILLIGLIFIITPASVDIAFGLNTDLALMSGVALIIIGFIWQYIEIYHRGQRAIDFPAAAKIAKRRLIRAGVASTLSFILLIILAKSFMKPGNPFIFTTLLPIATLLWALADATFAVLQHWDNTRGQSQ